MKQFLTFALCCGCLFLTVAADPVWRGDYFNDFEKAEVGKVPEDLFVQSGTAVVRGEAGNRFLETPGQLAETTTVLFGPDGQSLLDVSARVSATNAGRLFPEFAVGAGDVGGYTVWALPGPQKLELRKGDDVKASADYKGWLSGGWTALRLRVIGGAGKWKVEAKVWPAAEKEPVGWVVSFDDAEAPPAGRASVLANPFSETPVRFDDLKAATPAAGR